jgi:hypothetical protein
MSPVEDTHPFPFAGRTTLALTIVVNIHHYLYAVIVSAETPAEV